MGRPPRPQGEGLTYHVTARGNDRQPIFDDDRDRLSFLGLVEDTRQRRRWRVHAWCLMTNHFHLLLSTYQADISAGVRDVLGRYVRRYNHFHGRTGHLFGRRFHSVLVTTDEQFLMTVRYVNRNPVRAGLAPRPGHYAWSGYARRGMRHPLVTVEDADLLERLHPVRTIAERQLRELVDDDTPPRIQAPTPAVATLIQALGPTAGTRAAVRQGYPRRDIATVRGISTRTLQRQLRTAETGASGTSAP